ncbi:MAG: pyridoxal 5'-phosphate synthase glutaminase subunit PdxT [Terracidiphilus sp.]
MTKAEQQKPSIKDTLLDPHGPELGDDFLALCGERNRRFVEGLRAEEEEKRQEEARVAYRREHPRIGVLAIQGDYAAHAAALEETGAQACEVRKPEELAGIDALILPGGESTTMLKFLEKGHLFEALKEFCGRKPVFGTCAGAILLAREVLNPPQRSLGLLDAVVERNAYGRQIDSTILEAETKLPGGPLEMVFIRAPRIVEIGQEVEALAFREGFPTLVRQGSLMAATFHPELSSNRRVHRLFVEGVKAANSKSI